MSDSFDPYQEWLGIDPSEQPADYYRLLSLTRFETDAHSISVASDQRMNHIRSFQTGPRGKYTQPLLNEIALARRTLLNAEKRAEYDQQLRQQSDTNIDVDEELPPPAVPDHLGPPGDEALPQPTGPPAAVMPDPPANVVAPPPSRTTTPSVLQQRRKKSSTMSLIIMSVVGIVVVAGSVWVVGTFWNRSDPADKDKKKSGKTLVRKQPVKKKGLKRKIQSTQRAVEVMQEGNGDVNLSAAVAALHGSNIQLQSRGEFDVLESWTSREDWASWRFKVFKPGIFQMRITYQVPEGGGGAFELVLDDEPVKKTATRNGAPGFITDEMHLAVTKSGGHVLTVRPSDDVNKELMVLKSIRLISRPTGSSK